MPHGRNGAHVGPEGWSGVDGPVIPGFGGFPASKSMGMQMIGVYKMRFENIWVFPKKGVRTTKMDGENNGKPENLIKRDDLGVPYFRKHPWPIYDMKWSNQNQVLDILRSLSTI